MTSSIFSSLLGPNKMGEKIKHFNKFYFIYIWFDLYCLKWRALLKSANFWSVIKDVARVWPGTKMPGQLGNIDRTAFGLKVSFWSGSF